MNTSTAIVTRGLAGLAVRRKHRTRPDKGAAARLARERRGRAIDFTRFCPICDEYDTPRFIDSDRYGDTVHCLICGFDFDFDGVLK